MEPVTGTPVKIEERQRQSIVAEEDGARLTALEADFVSLPEEVNARVAEVRPRVGILEIMNSRLPWLVAGAGRRSP
nr:hypothetical protein GCM10020093_094560 [Planobispora longispora]